MRLHLLAKLRDHPLSRFGEQLRQREGGHALNRGSGDDGQRQRSEQMDLAFADDVVDQKLCRSGQNQTGQPIDGHQDQTEE